jgi:hypothetical protein
MPIGDLYSRIPFTPAPDQMFSQYNHVPNNNENNSLPNCNTNNISCENGTLLLGIKEIVNWKAEQDQLLLNESVTVVTVGIAP